MNSEQQNPFDDDSLSFLILSNAQAQYSLWPSLAQIPAGWDQVFGPTSRSDCLAWLDRNWTDIRPRQLREAQACAD